MSDLNTTATTPSKPSKSAGLSLYNRFACGAAALLALATAMILVATSQASQSARDMRDEAHTTLQQAGEELAPYWCSQITPDNVKSFNDLHILYLDVNDEVRNTVKQQCEKKVIINDLIVNNTPNEAFNTKSNECFVNESQTAMTCSVNVTANDNVKKDLASFSSATVTLTMAVHTTNSWITSKGHEVGEVATLTVDSNGTGSAQFEIPYDPTWGEYYRISVKSFYPNE